MSALNIEALREAIFKRQEQAARLQGVLQCMHLAADSNPPDMGYALAAAEALAEELFSDLDSQSILDEAKEGQSAPAVPSASDTAIRDDLQIVMDTVRIVSDELDRNTDTDRHARVLYHHVLEPLTKVFLALRREAQP